MYQDEDKLQLSWCRVRTRGELPHSRCGHSSVVFCNKLIVFGGNYENTYLNDTFSLDLTTGIWEEVQTNGPVIPQKRKGHTSLLYGDNMFIFGGFSGTGMNPVFNDLFSLNLVTKKWTQHSLSPSSPSQTVPRCYGHSAVLYDEKMIVLGGKNSLGQLNNFALLIDLKTFTFELISFDNQPALPPRNFHSCVALGENLIVFGGASNELYDDFWQLSIVTWKWEHIKLTSGQNSMNPKYQHTANYLSKYDKMIVLGGQEIQKTDKRMESKETNEAFIFCKSAAMVEKLVDNNKLKPNPRALHSANVLSDSSFVVFGGWAVMLTTTPTFYNDCWIGTVIGMDDKVPAQEDEPDQTVSTTIQEDQHHRCHGRHVGLVTFTL